MAALAIGIDYYQVISMFANLELPWPEYVERTFEYSSLAMGSIEVTSPECSVQMTYRDKWYGIQSLPILLAVGFLIYHVFNTWRKARKSQANTAGGWVRECVSA